MQTAAHTLTLLPRQARLINAAEGMRLEVQSGCLWLTRPGDAVDRFLTAGARIELHENLVLIQSDRHPGASALEAARYRLAPLQPAGPTLQALTLRAGAGLRGLLAKARHCYSSPIALARTP
jgi:hypothetical protein